MRGQEGWALTVAFSLGGVIASAGGDGSVHLWNSNDRSRLAHR
jgi:WD40 repeat protein